MPRIAALEDEFDSAAQGQDRAPAHRHRVPRLFRLAACRYLRRFRIGWADIDVDIRPGLQFEALPPPCCAEEVDLVISSDPENLAGVDFTPLFDYEPVLRLRRQSSAGAKPWIEAADFADQALITYPDDRARLDVFSQLLFPAGGGAEVDPAGGAFRRDPASRRVGARPCPVPAPTGCPLVLWRRPRGARSATPAGNPSLVTRRLNGKPASPGGSTGPRGPNDTPKPFMAQMLKLCRTEPGPKLQRGGGDHRPPSWHFAAPWGL